MSRDIAEGNFGDSAHNTPLTELRCDYKDLNCVFDGAAGENIQYCSNSVGSKSSHQFQFKEYKDSLKQKAEHLIKKEFPEKIVKLNELLETSKFQIRDLANVNQDLNIPVPPIPPDNVACANIESDSSESTSTLEGTPREYGITSGSVPCNKTLSDLIYLVKPHIWELLEDTNLLKMWITLMIPKIEDGNNFGVEVQEDALADIELVESQAERYFDQISRYFISRAKFVTKVAKYPHIEDYRKAVRELDEKEYFSLWLMLREIRNRYCLIYDIVTKNLDKIKKPRSSHSASLY